MHRQIGLIKKNLFISDLSVPGPLFHFVPLGGVADA